MEDLLINRETLERFRPQFDNLCRYLQAKQIIGVYHVVAYQSTGQQCSTYLFEKNRAEGEMQLILTHWSRDTDYLEGRKQKLLYRPLEKGVSRRLKLTAETTWHRTLEFPSTLASWIEWVFRQCCHFRVHQPREYSGCLLNTETQQMVFAQHKAVLTRTVEYLIKPEEPAPPARTVLPRPIRKVRK